MFALMYKNMTRYNDFLRSVTKFSAMKTCNGVSHIALHAAVTYLTCNALYYKMNVFMQI